MPDVLLALPTNLTAVSVSGATLGPPASTYPISWANQQSMPDAWQSAEGIVDAIYLYNESGVGFSAQLNNTRLTFPVPAGAWIGPIPATTNGISDTSITLTAVSLISGGQIALVQAMYLTPHKFTPDWGAHVLGNSPVGGMISTTTTTELVNVGNPAGAPIMNVNDFTGSTVPTWQMTNDGTGTWDVHASSTGVNVVSVTRVASVATAASMVIGDPLMTTVTLNGTVQTASIPILTTTNQEQGDCGFFGKAVAASDVWGYRVNFKTKMTNIPSSITLTVGTSANCTVAASNINLNGFMLECTATAAGVFNWIGTYTTVGN